MNSRWINQYLNDSMLLCLMKVIGEQAAWIKVETKAILSIHDHVITRNYRISLSHVDSRNFVLHIKDVEESDRGGYMCQLNTAPMMSQVGYLDVVFPPQIQRENTSSDIVTQEGSNITLTCVAKGYPTPNITWRREDTRSIMSSVNVTKQYESDSNLVSESLSLVHVNRSYNGAYLCIAINGVPTSVSQRILLQVHFLVGLVSVRSSRVSSFELTFVILFGKKNNGRNISPGKKCEIDVAVKDYKIRTVLRIRDIQSTDLGTYKCTADNSLGNAEGEIQIYAIPRTTSVPTFTIPWVTSTSPDTSSQNDLSRRREEEENHLVLPKEPRQAAKEESSPLYDDTPNVRGSKSIQSKKKEEEPGGYIDNGRSCMSSTLVCGFCAVLCIVHEVVT
ncbi:lachesin-like [Tachypleus tridentatus]|uniref:lachesin-like n=1 Tax=Tachypleus tridentatus TaxID=6853 RepID=UPI003FD01B4B